MGRIFAIILGVLLIIFIVFLGIRLRQGQAPLFDFGGQDTNLNIDLNEIMPDEWVPYRDDQIKGLQQVNIDTDSEDEWLLLYQYDFGENGPIGGVIYDAQNRPRGNDSIAIPDQSPAYLVPYRLLPDYHLPKTNGYLGDDKVEIKQVAVDITGVNPRNQEPLADRLMVRGKNREAFNRFSIFRWIDEETGYGAAYATTPGWFSLSPENPSDWLAWDAGEYIQELWSWEPRYDRSNLCRREQWLLNEDAYPRFVPRSEQEAHYDGEITFCIGQQPNEPAFPEAQVLAYLNDWKPERIDAQPRTEIPRYDKVEVLDISVPPELNNGIPPDSPEVKVNVDFNSNEGWRTMIWTVRMIPPETIKDAAIWRIIAAEDR